MIYFVDTNIFLRIIVDTDSKAFQDCLNFMKLVKTRKIDAVTCSLVLSEIEWVLRSTYKVSNQDLINQLEYIHNLPIVSINTYWDQTAIDNYSKHKVKLVDAQIASITQIKKKEWTVVSYDKDFDKLGVKRLEPSQIG